MYGAASASASSFVVHHTQQISMAAVAGDAENINKQARNGRKDWLNSPAHANWVKNKQEANGFLRSVGLFSCSFLLVFKNVSAVLGWESRERDF